MFTGIIEEVGRIDAIELHKSNSKIKIATNLIYKDLKCSDSVSVNGVCLTITQIKNKILSFEAVEETLNRTNLSFQKKGSFVNLERPLTVASRLGGHFVTGHIDGLARIKNISNFGNCYMELEVPAEFRKFIVEKGSVALDGISLTVGKVTLKGFIIYLIPYTLKNTNLGFTKEEDLLNLECDILAKYIQKTSYKEKTSNITPAFLKEHGFSA